MCRYLPWGYFPRECDSKVHGVHVPAQTNVNSWFHREYFLRASTRNFVYLRSQTTDSQVPPGFVSCPYIRQWCAVVWMARLSWLEEIPATSLLVWELHQ